MTASVSTEIGLQVCSRCGEAEAHQSHPWCRTCLNAYEREWVAGLSPERRRSRRVRKHLSFYFRLTPEQYDTMFELQEGVCAICGQPETNTYRGEVRMLAVDHDRSCCSGKRSCGKCIRELLCSKCNNGLGLFGDDPSRLAEALAYVLRHRKELSGDDRQ